jgi:hypothetical protein
MVKFNLDKEKTINAALFILQTIGETDYHNLFKILFFAEKEHLYKFGRPISGDSYVAMEYGPVPSFLYNLLKNQNEFFLSENKKASAKIKTDLDVLSESDIECLKSSVFENSELTFGQRTKKSHGSAYLKTKLNKEIDFKDIAIEAGAGDEMLKYIEFLSENQKPFVNA